MRVPILIAAALGALGANAVWAAESAPPETLTAERVVALARQRAPMVRAAQSRVLEARGRLAGARALGQENPTIEGVAATEDRFERRTSWEVSVPIGIGLSWWSRTGMARAELERESNLLADARRGAAGAALAAYFRVLHAARRVELAGERHILAQALRRTAAERERSGETPRLETLLAETEEARAQSALLAEAQHLTRARIELAANLALPAGESLAVSGDLADRGVIERALENGGAIDRPDVRAAEREVRAAKASRRLARTTLLPGLAFRLDYGHEDGEPLARPGLEVTVPIFQYGQERRAAARAREERALTELERARHAARAEVDGYSSAYADAVDAAWQLAQHALPRVEESEGMVQEAFRAGKINLPALLVVRRDLLETRQDHVDRLLEAALAGVDLAVARGLFQ